METASHSSILPSLPGISLISSLLTFNQNSVINTVASDQSPSVNNNSEPASSPTNPDSAEVAASSTTTTTSQRTTQQQQLHRRNTSDLGSAPEHRKMLAAADSRNSISSGMTLSREGSFMSGGTKRKRCSRPKTQYSICHPAPKLGSKSKISIRPRSLLQLHQLVSEGRPKPAFELLPSATFSPKLTRALARVFGARHSISTTDLALVRAEEYHRHEESLADDDESRDVLALICGAGKKENGSQPKMRIMFADGSDWEAYQMANGSYECSKTDVHGLKTTVRWVQKKSGMRTPDAAVETDMSTMPEKKFNFSTIAANTRRHPIIAHLTNTGLDISDVYSMPSPSTPALTPGLEDPASPGGEQIYTTDELRNVITATAAFVAVREGWCPSYRSEDSLQRSPSTKSVHSSYATPPGSPRKGDCELNRRSSSFRKAIRAPSLLRRTERPSSPTMEAVTPGGETAVNSAYIDAAPARRRARADTTSTVIVNANATQWRPDFDAPEEDDDEEEGDDDDGEEDKETVNGDQSDGASEVKPRGSRGSDRKVSETSSSGGESQYWNGNTEKATPRSGTVQEKKKKSKFLRILACGMF